MTELRGSVSELTLHVINKNSTDSNNSITITIPVDVSETIVSALQPDTVYSLLLTITVHGGHNITSQSATTHTTSGGRMAIIAGVDTAGV